MPRSDFARCLEAAQRRLNRANMEFARTEQLVAKKDMPAAFGSAFAFEAEVEKLAYKPDPLPPGRRYCPSCQASSGIGTLSGSV